jgi:5-methylcytosine-specific restriction endonuclease McrA
VHARELTRRLAELLHSERAALAEFLVALADFDRQRGWLELGYSSLFYFLHRELGLSKGAAYHRKVAAELLQEFPEVLEPLRDGRLCISSLVELAKVITPENRADVLPRFLHCSKREAMAVSAEIVPKAAPHRVMITAAAPAAAPLQARLHHPGEATLTPSADPLETHRPGRLGAVDGEERVVQSPGLPGHPCGVSPRDSHRPEEVVADVRHADGEDGVVQSPREGVVPLRGGGAPVAGLGLGADGLPPSPDPFHPDELAHVAPPARRDVAEPLTADLRRLHVTVTRRFIEKLEAARDALSHARPRGSVEEVLESALDLLLQQHAKKKGIVAKPRTSAATKVAKPSGRRPADGRGAEHDRAQELKARPAGSEHIPAAVKREVWTRDRGCCQWPLESGGICGSTLRVEFDHVRPRARGGPSTVGNLRLLCRAHNQFAARRAFGDELMDRATAAARSRPCSRSARDAPRHAARDAPRPVARDGMQHEARGALQHARDAPQDVARDAPRHAARDAPGASGRGITRETFEAAALKRPASGGGSHELAAPVHDANGG